MCSSRATFPKNERLSRKYLMELLFQKGLSFIAYPLRVIYYPIENIGESVKPSPIVVPDAPVSVLISIPKKKIKHAVDRNYIKRRIRESYRLRKHELAPLVSEKDKQFLLAFIYLSEEKYSFEKIDKAISKAIKTINSEQLTMNNERPETMILSI